MITQADLDHHLRRERQERALAERASDPGVRRSHLDLAESHARRVEKAKAILERQVEPVQKRSLQT
jgi:hypothetical protein